MPRAPVPQLPEKAAVESIEQRFRRLEAVWEAETLFLSDAQRIIEHPAFQEILALGPEVIPLMLSDLEKGPRQWVWALPRLTGVNPILAQDAGKIRKMSEAWLRWGRENGYSW